LKAVRAEQTKSGDMRPIHVMELSATPATANGKDTFSLLNGEAQPEIRQRLEARKTLRFHPAGNDKIEDQIAKQALEYEGHNAKVLIYVQKPEHAQSIEKKLTEKLKTNAIQRVALLTGTLRGHERDELVKKEIYQAFLKTETKPDQTVYLVSTSAGEVGVDWDADHLVCDLMPLDSMIQRLGRVNRRGGKESFIDCVVDLGKEKKGGNKDFEAARQETVKILENLPKCGADGYDASPQALTQLLESLSEDERRQAFSPQPDTAPVTDILLDAWSLTSVNQSLPGRPEVAEFLHGLIPAYDRLETYVAWRDEVRLLHSEAINEEALSEWFQRCRLETRERLRDRPERVFKQLEILSANSLNGSIPVILLNNRGEFERRLSLTKLVEEAKTDRQKSFLYYRTVILPADAGGLTEHGMLDAKAKIAKIDVAEAGGDRTRVILMRRGNEYRHTSLRSGKS
ncbi:MAG TPA: type I-U CRISPR-associated helicase/endonuclease Cas3, partial [bacterium]|nr:type I-U CRISPR-associated helicase/endonuclease Cas3 [bacterium]